MSSAEIDASEFYPQKVYHCLRLTSFFDQLYEEDCIRNEEDIMIALNNDLINGKFFHTLLRRNLIIACSIHLEHSLLDAKECIGCIVKEWKIVKVFVLGMRVEVSFFALPA